MMTATRFVSFALALGACVPPPAPELDDEPGASPGGLHTGSRALDIAPIAQQTPEWCWLATAEMIFRHYDVPSVNPNSYQCGIIAAYAGPQSACYYDCSQCVFGAGSEANAARVLSVYPQIAQQVFPQQSVTQLSTAIAGVVTPAAIQKQIDDGDPIELGITPTGPFQGVAGHAVIITGYEATATQFFVTINDPFPYDAVVGPQQNPYYRVEATALQSGQYRLEYNSLALLQWSATITVEPN